MKKDARKIIASFFLFLFLLGIDLVTKAQYMDVIATEHPSLLYLAGTINTGLAFSLPFNWWIWGGGLVGLIILVVLYLRQQIKEKSIPYIALACIAAGGIGNIWDRISYGGVRDFIHISNLSVFNVADVWVLLGLVLLVYREIKRKDTSSIEYRK